MYIYRALILMVFAFLFGASVIAQTNQRQYDLQNVLPPSPNASSLGKYADWPVNLFTGLPEIDIPIYALKGRGISIPVSLSYHASGIKVGETASSVGLGWSLQAGGAITRSVRGLPDDLADEGYTAIRARYNNPDDLSSGTITASQDSTITIDVANGNYDTEPDLYMVSALGHSYKFYILGNGKIVTQPYSNWKITANAADSSYTVLTEDGTKLVFGGGLNYYEISSSQWVSWSYISTWYLKSVTTTMGETINFNYYRSSIHQDGYYYQSDYTLSGVAANNLISGSPVTSKNAVARSGLQMTTMSTLASIESDLGRIDFDTISRSDLTGSLAITGIRVASKLTGRNIRRYKLYYSYSSVTSSNTFGGYGSEPYRLKLDSLQEMPADSSLRKSWRFEYNPLNLPSRNSYAQDYWGYYNGATTNTTLLPFVIGFNPDNYTYANRSADSVSMMAQMLTKITYPTGGYSRFNYEPNSYPAVEEQFTPSSVSHHLYLTYNQPTFTNTQTSSFTLTKAQYFKCTFTGSFSTAYMSDYGTSTTLAAVTLKNSSGTTLANINLVKGDNNVSKTIPSLLLNPGTYTFTTSSINVQADFSSSTQSVDLTSAFSYSASLGNKYVNHPLGGVRVRSIIDYDGIDSSKAIRKYYQYENPVIVAPVDSTTDYTSYTTDNTYDCAGGAVMTSCSLPGCLAYSVIFLTRSSSTKFSLGSIQGGNAGYGKVTESFGPNAENGKNVYYYTTPGDLGVTASKGFPYLPIISLDYERGLLLEKDQYTAGNVLVQKTMHGYQFTRRSVIESYKAAFLFNILSACYSYSFLSQILSKQIFYDYSYQVKDTSVTQISYNTATGDSLKSVLNNYYDDTLNMQPTRTLTFNSKGDSVLQYYRSALEKTAINASMTLSSTASAAVDTMVNRNMVANSLQTEKYVKSVLISKVLGNYRLQSGLVLSDNVVVQNVSNPAETRVSFTKYDIYGNLQEQQKYRDARRDYIWDYKNTYPIAEVIGGDSLSAYTSFEADGSGGWTIGSAVRDSTTQALTGYKSYTLGSGSISRSGLSSGNTYIVSYWSRNGSYTVTGSSSLLTGKSITLGAVTWTYYEHTVTGVSAITISGTGSIDELRLYLAAAQMSSYTYDPLIGVTSACDVGNRVTYFQYDGFGRLYIVKDQDGNTIKKYCYSYNGQNNACQQFYNVAKSGSYTRNNCAAGGAPSSVTYTVPAGKYYSLISQAVADSLAQADVTANGQAYANANGTCTFSNVAQSGTYTRNNCGTGYIGSSVTYTVAAGTYTSTVSQATADSLAQAAVTANGQTYANTNGTCTQTYTITATNNTALTGFYVTFTNTSTSVATTFYVAIGGGTLGTLPAGTYNVYMAKTSNTTLKYIYTVCSTTKTPAVTATFTSITLSASCHTVTIDTQE